LDEQNLTAETQSNLLAEYLFHEAMEHSGLGHQSIRLLQYYLFPENYSDGTHRLTAAISGFMSLKLTAQSIDDITERDEEDMRELVKFYRRRAGITRLKTYFRGNLNFEVRIDKDETTASFERDRNVLNYGLRLLRADISQETRLFFLRRAADYHRLPEYEVIQNDVKYYLTLEIYEREKIVADIDAISRGDERMKDFLNLLSMAEYSSDNKVVRGKLKLDPVFKERVALFVGLKHKDMDLEDGTRVHYTVGGAETSPVTFVFLHGWLLNSRDWRLQIAYLEGKYKTIAIDTPGFGRSKLGKKKPTMEDYASYVKSVLDQEDAKNVIIVGHSMGGMIAMHYEDIYAALGEGRVVGFVAIATSAVITYKGVVNFLKKGLTRIHSSEFLKFTPAVAVLSLIWTRDSLKAILRTDAAKTMIWRALVDKVLPENLKEYYERVHSSVIKTPWVGIHRAFSAIIAHNTLERLEKIQVPVQWMIGEDDWVISPEIQFAQLASIANVDSEVFEGASHFPQTSNPMGINRSLDRFATDIVIPRLEMMKDKGFGGTGQIIQWTDDAGARLEGDVLEAKTAEIEAEILANQDETFNQSAQEAVDFVERYVDERIGDLPPVLSALADQPVAEVLGQLAQQAYDEGRGFIQESRLNEIREEIQSSHRRADPQSGKEYTELPLRDFLSLKSAFLRDAEKIGYQGYVDGPQRFYLGGADSSHLFYQTDLIAHLRTLDEQNLTAETQSNLLAEYLFHEAMEHSGLGHQSIRLLQYYLFPENYQGGAHRLTEAIRIFIDIQFETQVKSYKGKRKTIHKRRPFKTEHESRIRYWITEDNSSSSRKRICGGEFRIYLNPRAEDLSKTLELVRGALRDQRSPNASFKYLSPAQDAQRDPQETKIVIYLDSSDEVLRVIDLLHSQANYGEIQPYGILSNTIPIDDLMQISGGMREIFSSRRPYSWGLINRLDRANQFHPPGSKVYETTLAFFRTLDLARVLLRREGGQIRNGISPRGDEIDFKQMVRKDDEDDDGYITQWTDDVGRRMEGETLKAKIAEIEEEIIRYRYDLFDELIGNAGDSVSDVIKDRIDRLPPMLRDLTDTPVPDLIRYLASDAYADGKGFLKRLRYREILEEVQETQDRADPQSGKNYNELPLKDFLSLKAEFLRDAQKIGYQGFVEGRGRFYLGGADASHLFYQTDLIAHLRALDEQNLAAETQSNLLAEYLFHEAMEHSGLGHQSIRLLQYYLFPENYPNHEHLLTRTLREFIEIQNARPEHI
ncbi:MAG: alpha/beta hydrolase, partial [Chlamydiota bacterium]|nr:alpha/beta hydrolase [Chlamydiota bacterium]